MEAHNDSHWMREAWQLARQGLYTASPNPCVGAVLVDPETNQCLAQGFHAKTGLPHAEVQALAGLSTPAAARGATCYVTLEPCAHWGRTGPCVEQLLSAGVQRVVLGLMDPDPRVQGAGAAALRDAGCRVAVDSSCTAAISQLNVGFLSAILRDKPWVDLKLACTADGRVAAQNGASQWISGPVARWMGQQLRAQADAIVTGIGTVLCDAPRLTVRPESWPVSMRTDPCHPLATWEQIGQQPALVVCDNQLRIPLEGPWWDQPDRLIWIATTHKAVEQRPAHYLQLQQRRTVRVQVYDAPVVPLESLLQDLHAHAMRRILVEAGPALTQSWLQSGLVDAFHMFLAPKWLGVQAQPWWTGKASQHAEQAILSQTSAWQTVHAQVCGVDGYWILQPRELVADPRFPVPIPEYSEISDAEFS